MKTLPEILGDVDQLIVKQIFQPLQTYKKKQDDATWSTICNGGDKIRKYLDEAIAKELMGCLPEKKTMEAAKSSGSDAGWGCTYGFNEALDEVRARLTAFIGRGEK